MNKTLRTFILIAAMVIATGQTWAALTDGLSNFYVEPATGGTVTLYDNQGCTGDPITNAESCSTVYLKAVPDIVHGFPTADMITVEKTVDSGAAQSRGANRSAANIIGLGEYVDVTAVGNGIFSFTMPDDGTNVSITVTFPKASVSYINAAGQTVDTGNETVRILTGTETSLDAGWYVTNGTLNYTQTITLNGDVHLILQDGAVMNIGTEQTPVSGNGISNSDYSFSIYAQSTGDSKGKLRVNATYFAINAKNVTISGGQVSANGNAFGICSLGNVTISGGQVTANGGTDGIVASGNIILGWTSLTDFIQAKSYYSENGFVSIAEDKAFAVYSGETLTSYLPSGTLNDDQVWDIRGKTLRPVTSIPVVQNLTITDVTATGATLTWEPGNVETQWQVAYSTDGGTTWSNAETVTTTTYTLTGLTAGTAVTVRVRSYYNDNLYSDFATCTFTTSPPVTYLDADGSTKQCADYTVLTGSETSLDAGWYVAESTLNYSQTIWLDGDVHLILQDGAVMNVGTEESLIDRDGISGVDYSFSIYAQSTGDSKGQLRVNATDDAIYTKNVTICGGQVTASGSEYGIYIQNDAIISGGQVTASGGYGIRSNVNVAISGGQVTASGSSSYGIYATGNFILGWTSLTDFIQTNSYYSQNGTVSIAEGKAFAVYNGETLTSYLPSGTLNDDQVWDIGGKTLRPVTSIPVVAPQNLTVTDRTATAATLTWEPGDLETQWQVAYSTDGGSNWSNAETVTTTTYTLTGLTAGIAVTLRVRSYYNDNLYSDYATCTFTTSPPVTYLNAEGNTQQCASFTILTGSEGSLDAGWYVAEGTLNYGGSITLNDDVHLILKDGAVMNVGTEQMPLDVSQCISANGHSLSIYAQSTADGMGKLNIYSGRSNAFGIYMENGNLTINGGEVTSGSSRSFWVRGGDFTINGGAVTATQDIIVDGGTLTLSWTSLTDFIRAGSYQLYNGASVVIAEGKMFAVYSGESLESYLESGPVTNVSRLFGKTLRPVTSIPVAYLDKGGIPKKCMEYTVLTGNETELAEGWYVANGTLNYGGSINLTGDVHLILKDGAVMNIGTEQQPIDAFNCIYASGHSLSIYAQSTGDVKGKLNLYSVKTSGVASGIHIDSGTLTINGGEVTSGSENSFNIGGDFTINGGQVTATQNIFIDGGTLTMGWTSANDFIKAASYQLVNNASVAIAEDRAFKVYDGESLVAFLGSGTLTSQQVTALYGKTLRPSNTSTPEAPQGLVASLSLANGLTSAKLSWLQFDDDAKDWLVAYSTDGGTNWSNDVTVTEPVYSMTELAEGQTVTVRVRTSYSEELYSDYTTYTFTTLSPVDYIDAEGNTQTCTAYTTLTGMEDSIGIETNTEGITRVDDLVYEESWYVASGKIDYLTELSLGGNVHLILADDAEVNFPELPSSSIIMESLSIFGFPAKLNIYGQQAGTGTINAKGLVALYGLTVNGGTLNATFPSATEGGAITVVGDFTVNGGTVFAQNAGAGIMTMYMGASREFSGFDDSEEYGDAGASRTLRRAMASRNTEDEPTIGTNIAINGGKVTAIGGYFGMYSQGDITINGGQVTARTTDETTEWSGLDASQKAGIVASGDITLGATKASDYIYATRYVTGGTLAIADGTTLYDEDGNEYSGVQTLIPNPDYQPADDPEPQDLPLAGTYAIDGKTLLPDLPRNLTASVTNGVVSLSWTGSKESYNVRYRETGTETWTVANGITTLPYTLSNLTADTQYVWQVQGVIDSGEGSVTEWSDVAYFMSVVTYLDENGAEQQCTTYTTLTGKETTIGEGWYVALGKTDYASGIALTGDVHLILTDGAEVNFPEPPTSTFGDESSSLYGDFDNPANLNLYGQQAGTGTINAKGMVLIIGNLTVNGGTLNATTSIVTEYVGSIGVLGKFTVNGGVVFAKNPAFAISTMSPYMKSREFRNFDDSEEFGAAGASRAIRNMKASRNTQDENLEDLYCDFVVNGGEVTAISSYYSIATIPGNIIVNGGKVTAITSDEYLEELGIDANEQTGMFACGDITLNCTKASDFIHVSRYVSFNPYTIKGGNASSNMEENFGTVAIAEGTTLFDEDGNEYSGVQPFTLGDDNWSSLWEAIKTISYPVDGKTLQLSGCRKPQNLAVSELRPTSATVTWQPGGEETQWAVSYRDINAGEAMINETFDNISSLPSGWGAYTYAGVNSITPSENAWHIEDGALVPSEKNVILTIPVQSGDKAYFTLHGSDNYTDDPCILISYYQGNLNDFNPWDSKYVDVGLSTTPQTVELDLSGYEGEGYLYVDYYGGVNGNIAYIEQIMVTEPAAWSEPVMVTEQPSYTLENLTPETPMQVSVQAVCDAENGDMSRPATISFYTSYCEPENQCAISYTLGVSDSQYPSWYGASIKVIHHETGAEVGKLTYKEGAVNTGELSLCNGETYDFVFELGEHYPYPTFTLTAPDGHLIADESLVTAEGQFAQYTMDCDACKVPRSLAVSDIHPTSATVTWQPGGDETQWKVSYRDADAEGATLFNEDFDELTSLPDGWESYHTSNGSDLTSSDDWHIDNGVMACTNSQSLLFIPIQFGGKARLTVRGSNNSGQCIIGCARSIDVYAILDSKDFQLSENSQEVGLDMSAFEGDGYLFIYYMGGESNTAYIEQIMVTGPAAWSEPVMVSGQPTYTIEPEALASGATMQVRVQSACSEENLSYPATISFRLPLCEPQYQCAIAYELADSDGNGWNEASIAVVRAYDGKEVATLTITERTTTLSGELPLCPGEYNFIWKSGNSDSECSFTLYDPDGNVIVSQSNPSAGSLLTEPYVHSCGYDFAIINNSKSNSTVISENVGKTRSVMLKDRTLYKDGAWNTLCLPFPMSTSEIANSPLAGGDIRTLSGTIVYENKTTSFDSTTGTLTLIFTPSAASEAPASEAVTSIVAGTPYIIKWARPDGYSADGGFDITDPVFTGVTIDATTRDVECDLGDGKSVTFRGTYDYMPFGADNRSILFLGDNNTLYWPQSGASIGASRAYFALDGLTAGNVKAARLFFGDNEQTGIISIENGKLIIENAGDAWYTLDGKKLDKAPVRKGLYIRNGKKVVVK